MLISVLTCEQDLPLLLNREYREGLLYSQNGSLLRKILWKFKKAQKKKEQQTNMYISVFRCNNLSWSVSKILTERKPLLHAAQRKYNW